MKQVQVYRLSNDEYSIETISIDDYFFDFLVRNESKAFKKQPLFDEKWLNARLENWYELNC